jgi:ABC-type antimicrobial peptide transport system permease subunit
MALGAQSYEVVWLILKQGMVLITLGVGVGLLASKATTHLIADFLFGVAPMDATALLGGTLLLILIAGLACYVPAHRATKIDPMVTLRTE